MKQHSLASAAFLLTLTSINSWALAGFVTFAGLDRATIISPAGQTFTWTSDGQTDTVTVRPVGSTQYLNPTVPYTANGRGPFSNFHTGVRSLGGSVDVSFEFLFSRPIDITTYNTETLASKELMTLQTGSIGNGIEIQIDAVGVPEPASISLVRVGITRVLTQRSRRNRQSVKSAS